MSILVLLHVLKAREAASTASSNSWLVVCGTLESKVCVDYGLPGVNERNRVNETRFTDRIMNVQPLVRLALNELSTDEVLGSATRHTGSLPFGRDVLRDWLRKRT